MPRLEVCIYLRELGMLREKILLGFIFILVHRFCFEYCKGDL
jgi:hypothetical protein